jgi:hypothetical protein
MIGCGLGGIKSAAPTAPASRRKRNVASDATPRPCMVVTKVCRSMCGYALASWMPAVSARWCRRRVAACRSIRAPRVFSWIGPLVRALIHLEDLARAMLFEHLSDQAIYDDALLRKAELLIRQPDGSYVFRHYSLGEYFLACAVLREMASYSSKLLSRMDLVYANSINRFLIPMVKAAFQRAETKEPATEAASKMVTIRDFHEFTERTGWRKTGFGRWNAMVTADGTLPWESTNVQESSISLDNVIATSDGGVNDSRVTGISWYDAFQYCRWKGGRLPTTQEITAMVRPNIHDGREWSSSWYEETRALITVVRMSAHQKGACTIFRPTGGT